MYVGKDIELELWTGRTTYRQGQPLRWSSSTMSNPWQAAGPKLRMSGHGIAGQPKKDPRP